MRRADAAIAVMMLGLGACKDELPVAATSLSMTPSVGPDNRETEVEIQGDFLVARVGADLADPQSSTVERMMVARLGDFELTGITVLGLGHVRALVPGRGMPIQSYDLLVEDAEGRTTVLGQAFTIRAGTCEDLGLPEANACAGRCSAEPGCGCTADGCGAVCGDGVVRDGEACDDGTKGGQPGCTADCRVQEGWHCSGSPSTCAPICGDGKLIVPERCDDGGNAAGDGCAPDCKIESMWRCRGMPSVCERCGDSVLQGIETCDDGNRMEGDGCGALCRVEPGWSCDSTHLPSMCTASCGDRTITGSEKCDDGNIDNGDGCSESCEIEPGACCLGEPSSCNLACGDGKVGQIERCDDGNREDGDGCSSCCDLEPGYYCLRQPSICFPKESTTFVSEPAQCPGRGTFEEPFCTFGDGVLAPPDKMVVLPGRYQESVSIEQRELYIFAEEGAVLEGPGELAALGILNGAQVHVLGLVVRSDHVGVSVADGALALLEQCELGPGQGTAVQLVQQGLLGMDRCFVHENRGGGLRLDGQHYAIFNTVIANNGDNQDGTLGGVLIVSTSSASLFVNNTVSGNRSRNGPGGVECSGLFPVDTVPIYNSIIFDNGPGSGVSAACFPHNCLLDGVIVPPFNNNIGGDPGFIQGDPRLHLERGSRCIDAALVDVAPPHDLDGEPRPLRNGADIGADEVP